jgi:hypothetical protein
MDGIDIPGRTDAQRQEIALALREYLNRYYSEHGRGAVPTIVIHAHGGLVDRCDGYLGAAQLEPLYEQADAFSIFPIYNVGLGESVDKGWSGASAYAPELGGDGRAMAVGVRFFGGGVGLTDGPFLDPRALSIATRNRMRNAELSSRIAGGRDHGDVTRFEEDARFGFLPFLDEGLGTGGHSWSYMKWTIDRSFEIDGGSTPFPVGTSAGLALIDTIKSILREDQPRFSRFRIVLVGHSTGAIYVTKFARRWNGRPPSLPSTFEMILLASALRYDDLETFLREDAAKSLVHFRAFNLSDELERNNVEGPVPGLKRRAYPRSLLYAVSGIFEAEADTPLTGMQRFNCEMYDTSRLRKRLRDQKVSWDADLDVVDRVNKELAQLEHGHAFVYSPSSGYSPLTNIAVGVGFRTAELTHGGFPTDPATDSSIYALVADPMNWNQDPGSANISCPAPTGTASS